MTAVETRDVPLAAALTSDDVGAAASARENNDSHGRRWWVSLLLAPLRIARFAAFAAAWVLIALVCASAWGPRFTDVRTDVIIGSSMEPSIPLWSEIVVQPVPASDIRIGDVITYQRPDRPDDKVTHRVVDIVKDDKGSSNPIFLTKGDNNKTVDPWKVQYTDAAAWRVKTHVPFVGYVRWHAQSKWARVALVVVPTLLILMMFLKWLWTAPTPESGRPTSAPKEPRRSRRRASTPPSGSGDYLILDLAHLGEEYLLPGATEETAQA